MAMKEGTRQGADMHLRWKAENINAQNEKVGWNGAGELSHTEPKIKATARGAPRDARQVTSYLTCWEAWKAHPLQELGAWNFTLRL